VEETIKTHQVTSCKNTLPAPIAFRSERVKQNRSDGRALRKPKRVSYALPRSWLETSHETEIKAKQDVRYAEKKKSVIIERLPESMNHDAIVQAVLDCSDYKHKAKFRSTHRIGKQSEESRRMVKVNFETEEAASDFARLFRTATTNLIEGLALKPYVRRDLTQIELGILF